MDNNIFVYNYILETFQFFHISFYKIHILLSHHHKLSMNYKWHYTYPILVFYRKDQSILHILFHFCILYIYQDRGSIYPYYQKHFFLRKIHYLHNHYGMILEFHYLLFDCNRNRNYLCIHHIDYRHRFQVHDIFYNNHDNVSIAIFLYYFLQHFYLNI